METEQNKKQEFENTQGVKVNGDIKDKKTYLNSYLEQKWQCVKGYNGGSTGPTINWYLSSNGSM